MTLIPLKIIENKIYLIRNKKVMLDRDLSELYGVETRILNQAVKRNFKRFPSDFSFSLTRKEIMRISQIVTSSNNNSIKFSKNVMAFTEQGVAMLSSILNSDRAIQINIAIMRVFVKLRKLIEGNKELDRKLNQLELKVEQHDDEIKAIFNAIRQLTSLPEKPARKIGFHEYNFR
ncbi:MAG: ORF6N domain-containing protein [Deltaproteobacteria bacterium]|jgi:hypothetical protein|nr:ORF6N domain-containing protein [Deltaproteobacteria bacterium]